MEQLVAPTPGRTYPRWSRLFTGGAAQTVSSPALIAGLIDPSAMVCVGPPLLASPAGSSSGLVLQNEVPLVLEQPVPVKPHVAPSSMLWPPSVTVPPNITVQLPPVLSARMLLVTVAEPSLRIAPPAGAGLPEELRFVMFVVPPLKVAPVPPWKIA